MTKTQKPVGGLKKSVPVFNSERKFNRSESTWKKKPFYRNTCMQYARKFTNDLRENTRRNSRSLASNCGLSGVTNV